MYTLECDLEQICQASSIDWKKLKDKTIFLTGSTGLIGTTIANGLAYANKKRGLNLKIICAVRNLEKAVTRLDSECILLQENIIEKILISESIDYIIHAASPTSSSFFVNNPVETIKIATSSTISLLDLAKEKRVKGFVYLSSMEVYGHPMYGYSVKESDIAGFDPLVTRNCYPLSKLICEMLCKSYKDEYQVPAMIVRLTQTFGPGVDYNDSRVFAEFMRCVLEKKDIVLHTTGRTERCYLYTCDAATAILTVLTKGHAGEAYTAANPNTYCSIIDMAKTVAHVFTNDSIEVKVELDDIERGYADELHMMLDVSKLIGLGWNAKSGIIEMFNNMIESVKSTEKWVKK